METQHLLSARGLGMMRGERVLFGGVALDVAAGEAVLLRGANGAGKTTLLRILAGLTRPEAGSVERRAAHHWIGHRDGLKPHETPRAHLQVWARAWGSAVALQPLLDSMGLARAADVAARDLSAGQRRRASLARLSLVARPVWLMDEPFTALDAGGRAQLLDAIAAHRAGGGAVVMALHGEADFVASREITL